MKRGAQLFLCTAALLSLIPFTAFAERRTVNLQSVIIETFDDPEASPWMLQGSRFSSRIRMNGETDEYPKLGFVEAWPDALFRRRPEGRDLRVLGVHGKFDRMGYNYIQIIPVRRDVGGEFVHRPIPIPGRVRNLDLWVWGSNHDFYLEVHLVDFRGIVHVLPLGDIRFVGWRNLQTDIPAYIPQEVVYVPARRGLDLVKFVLWTRPHEKVDNFFVYLDQVKIITDLYESRFDGEDLANPAHVQELWQNATGRN